MLSLWNVFDDVMRFEPWSWSNPAIGQERRFVPPLDVAETEQAWVVHVELPGMKAEEVHLECEGDVLNISGQKPFDASDDSRGYRFNERRYGSFVRSLTLPTGVDAEAIEADMRDGVLTITLPKLEQARPRQIPISGASPQLKQATHEQIAEGQSVDTPATEQ